MQVPLTLAFVVFVHVFAIVCLLVSMFCVCVYVRMPRCICMHGCVSSPIAYPSVRPFSRNDLDSSMDSTRVRRLASVNLLVPEGAWTLTTLVPGWEVCLGGGGGGGFFGGEFGGWLQQLQ